MATKKLSKKRASKELDTILESVAKPQVIKAQKVSALKSRLNGKNKRCE